MLYTPKHRRFLILVPATNDHLGIDPGSAIVTRDPLTPASADGRICIYYEGNRFGAENLRRYRERLISAAGRDSERYPTVARSWVNPDEVKVVGTFDLFAGRITSLAHPGALATWLDKETLDPDDTAPRYVVYAASQADADDPLSGYWDNVSGWGDLRAADLYSTSEKHLFNDRLPIIGSPDAQWVDVDTLTLPSA